MIGQKNLKISNEQVIEQEFVSRLRNQKQALSIFVGETGSGKSWSSIFIAEKMTEIYGSQFSVDDIVFTPIQFLKRFKELQSRPDQGVGSVIIWDEAGVGMNARTAMSAGNIAISEIFEMLRFSRISVFFTVPTIHMIDVNLRRMFHFILFAQPIDRTTAPFWQRNLSTCRIYKVVHGNTPGEKDGDFRTACPRISVRVVNSIGEHFVRSVRVPQMWMPMADKQLLDEYEAKKKAYFLTCVDRAQSKLEKIERKLAASNGILPERPVPSTPQQPYPTPISNPVPEIPVTASATSAALERMTGRRVA